MGAVDVIALSQAAAACGNRVLTAYGHLQSIGGDLPPVNLVAEPLIGNPVGWQRSVVTPVAPLAQLEQQQQHHRKTPRSIAVPPLDSRATHTVALAGGRGGRGGGRGRPQQKQQQVQRGIATGRGSGVAPVASSLAGGIASVQQPIQPHTSAMSMTHNDFAYMSQHAANNIQSQDEVGYVALMPPIDYLGAALGLESSVGYSHPSIGRPMPLTPSSSSFALSSGTHISAPLPQLQHLNGLSSNGEGGGGDASVNGSGFVARQYDPHQLSGYYDHQQHQPSPHPRGDNRSIQAADPRHHQPMPTGVRQGARHYQGEENHVHGSMASRTPTQV